MNVKQPASTAHGRVFDRIPQFDPRSRSFPVRALLPKKKPRGYTWSNAGVVLDQGYEGACVGFAWAHELICRPKVYKTVTDHFARALYREAQRVDEWEGEDYEGTSVLAGAKVVNAYGHIPEYRWAFGLDDLILAVGYAGPAVLGLNWYGGMFETDREGYVKVQGEVLGGHAICAFSVNVKQRFFRLLNSWGVQWGQAGSCKVTFEDMERLLHEQGEACIPVRRNAA